MNNHTERPENKSRIWRRVLLLLAMVITALAVAVTCALTVNTSKTVNVGGSDEAEAAASGNYANLTGDTLKTYISNGSFTNGNYVDYTYNGSYYTLNLPRGTYKYELWGAQGGDTGSYAANSGNANGGRGGYVAGTITYTADSTTIYIYCGGNGAGGTGNIDGGHVTRAGGYNGGGYGVGTAGAGGGGATDIRMTGGTATNATSYNTRIMVAGGGGGGYNKAYTEVHQQYSIYFGRTGCYSQHSSRWPNDEGGGGGGYYGGNNLHSDDPRAGYCGSNYISGSFTSTSSSYGNASATGNGKARITAISVNQAPVSNNRSISLPVRGSTVNYAVAANYLASDKDYTNNTNAGLDKVYFTDGTTNNYDSFTKGANDGLYVDSGCTKSASEYFSWTWSGNNSFTINRINKYPRSGYDGCTTNGTITLYTRVRDNFGSGTSARGISTISFTVTVPANTISKRGSGDNNAITSAQGNNKLYFGMSQVSDAPSGSGINTSQIYNPLGVNRYTAVFEQPLRYNDPVTIKASDLIVGDLANGQISSTDMIVASLSSVAEITGSSRKYMLQEYDSNPSGLNAYNAARAKLVNVYDTLTFKCVTPDPAYQVFTVTVYQVEKAPISALGLSNVEANVSANAGGKTAITVDIVFKMDNTRPVLRDDLTNGPVVSVGTLGRKTVKLNDYYKDIDGLNNNITSNSHQIREVVVPTNEYIQINKYGEILSTVNTANGNKSYFNVMATSTAEDPFGNALESGQLKGDDFKTGFKDWYISDGTANTDVSYIQYSFNNDELTITGLRATYSLYDETRTSNGAITGGTTTAPTMGTGVLNAGHFYILLRIQDKNDTADDAIWLPLGIEVTNRAPNTMQTERDGAGASIMPTADGKPGDTFYFTPMGITFDQQVHPIGARQDTKNGGYVSGDLIPLAADADNYYRENMLNGYSLTAGQTETGKLNELVRINPEKQNALQTNVNHNNDAYYFSVELIDIYIPVSYFGGRVKLGSAAYPTTSDTINYNGVDTTCVIVKGIKITLNNWTHNRYLHLNVEMIDSFGATCTSSIAVNVSNIAPEYLNEENVARLNYTVNGVTVESRYSTPAKDADIATITYRVPNHTTFIVTPYDLVSDVNTPLTSANKAAISNGFTLNGLSGIYNDQNGVLSVGGGGSGMSFTGIATSANTGTDYSTANYINNLFGMIGTLQSRRVFSSGVTSDNRFTSTARAGSTDIDRLYFARTIDDRSLDGFDYDPYSNENRQAFAEPEIAGSSYVTYSFGSRIDRKVDETTTSYNLDYLVISTTKRTVSGSPVQIELTVRDRTGSAGQGAAYGIKKIRISIEIINSSPRVQYPNKYYTLTTDPVKNHTVTDFSNGEGGFANDAVTPSTLVIYATSDGNSSDSANASKNFLIDNEDPNVYFDVLSGFSVLDEKGSPTFTYTMDGQSRSIAYDGYFVKVSLTANTITITALNSTQAVKELYIKFYATDGRYDDSGRLETAECKIRIEVLNAGLKYNTSENGFELDDGYYLWNVESVNTQDMSRTRYFASGSQAADLLRTDEKYNASSAQIKYLTTDSDGLQGAVLSAATSPFSNRADSLGYVNANVAEGADDNAVNTAYRNAVPRLGLNNLWNVTEGNKQLAIAALLAMRKGTNYITGKELEDNVSSADIVYFVKDGNSYTSYTATDLIENGNFADANFRSKFFDDQGRWIVTYWAVMVTPTGATAADSYINLRLSLRDETRLGGDTANKNTAFKAGNSSQTVVFNSYVLQYNLFVNGMGIVPYSYYNQYDGYYVVTDANDQSVAYVPTYDNEPYSEYDKNYDSLFFNYDANNSNNNKITTTSGTVEFKKREGGKADNTKAGVHSGVVYSKQNTQETDGYTYPIYSAGQPTSEKESAFKYSDTIHVSGDKNVYTYVPMSYFALNTSIVGLDDASFSKTSYVSYDRGVNNNQPYVRKEGYNQAVTISDGVNKWLGSESNPYVEISGYDVAASDASQADKDNFKKSPYLNNCISVSTADGASAAKFVANAYNSGSNSLNENIANNIVGDKGQLLYLANQTDLTNGLQEHLFGLKLRKKYTRAQSTSLTITINVVQSSLGETGTVPNYGASTSEGSVATKNQATVTFKLAIDNSPINLVGSANGVTLDTAPKNNVGYYTSLNLTTDSGTQTISLSREDTVAGANKVIKYADNDIAYKTDSDGNIVDKNGTKLQTDANGNFTNGTPARDDSKSDTAKFAVGSIRQIKFDSASEYNRVKEFTGENNNIEFTNVSTAESGKYAQKSVSNYLKAWDSGTINLLSENYIPNGGIYTTNGAGFEKYFTVGFSQDNSSLTITPRAKTIINSEMLKDSSGNNLSNNAISAYYEQRGLKLITDGKPSDGAYYPLKVLIYDDHGDGFGAASYVALEIRVSISGTAAKLSDNLDDSDNKDGKKIDVSLAIGSPYTLNLAYVIAGGSLLKDSENNFFWKSDYDELKKSVGSYNVNFTTTQLDDLFKLESGTYLKSPFDNSNNIQNYTTNASDLGTLNNDLRNGNAKYSSHPEATGVTIANLPDVIMYMNYIRPDKQSGILVPESAPVNNDIFFMVNRRTTYQTTENNITVSKQQNKFTFKLNFEDNAGNSTRTLYVNIDVINQTPSILSLATSASSNLQMQVGDKFNVLTTPYNKFVGSSKKDSGATDSTTHSASAQASNSYNTVVRRSANNYRNIGEAYLLERNATVRYEQLTEQGLEGAYKLHSYTKDGGSNQHLGYVAIADDDTPWGLRIESVSFYNSKCFQTAVYYDRIAMEDGTTGSYSLDVEIEAKAVCTNMPITISLVDSDHARITFTMYVTVVSSKPRPIAEGDTTHPLNKALTQVRPLSGVYSMYMISSNVTDKVDTKNSIETATYKEVKVGNVNVKAYRKVRLPIEEIAYDPDSGDVLAMYAENRQDNNYNVVSLNNSAMTKDGNKYSNDMFTVEISSDYRWFTIECKTYNPYSDEDVLRFYVRDSGNNIFENAIPIEIRICTLYSSITNSAQMTNTAIRLEQFQRGAISSINVKSFDDYSGTSVDLPEDEEELAKIKDVDSTFQFLNYPNMPESVDQTLQSAKPIDDPDIVKSLYNRNYELRIYAFMSKSAENESEFEALSLDSISALFNLNQTVVNKRVLALKSNDALIANGVDINKFLIGGFTTEGISLTNVNRSLIMFLQRYFFFDVGEDGVSLSFRPISANHGVDIPLYVQIKKFVGSGRSVAINDTDTTCGNIFYVNVKDSAPIATKESNVLQFKGKVGDSTTFKLYDKEDPFGSLFTDSDLNDRVVYNGFVSDAVQSPDYNKAFVNAGELDWRAVETISKPQAVELSVNPAHDEVKVTIKRRIDVKDDDGNYLDEVTLPIMIYGKDRGGRTASVQVEVTICNSDIDIDRTKIVEVTPDTQNGYYQLSADSDNKRLYYIDAYIVPGKTMTPFYFVDRQNTYISDPDFTRMSTDTDSMRLVGAKSATSDTYLMHGKTLSVRSEKETNPVATVTPLFGFEGVSNMPEDAYHFVGFSIEALTYNREIDDATATMRVIDRSGNPDVEGNGFTVTLRIHILNAAPTLKPVDNKPFIITGSNTVDGEPIVIDIHDYVTDLNNDPLRIVGLSPVYSENAELENLHCVLDSESAGDLVDMDISEDQTKCTFTPKAGYYGEQSIRVRVADIMDGNSTSEFKVVDFIVSFVIGYDISSIKLNDITAIRSLPTKVDVKKLFNNIQDTFGIKDHETEEPGEFNPGADYVITELSADGVRVYKDGDDWMFVGDRVADQIKFNVTFKNKAALEESSSILMTFNAVIGKNSAPKLLEDFKNHSDEGYLFQTSSSEYGLDNNGTVTLSPSMLFSDDDLINGDRMMFDPKAISVSAPTICSVRVSEDGSRMYLTFNCSGECDITVGVMDSTGETVKYTFKVKNIDRPEPSFWNKIMISYEVYPFIWWGIGIGILALIALIILIVLLVKRRKRKREELEAILISEMELEEQMMRLNAGAMGAAPYQSFGFLPPTMNVQNDPGLMLGSGGAAPNPGAIGLNPGAPGDNGVPTDSDM